jgi:acyl phosphate:glycerol-3-phosphate acyltransferase
VIELVVALGIGYLIGSLPTAELAARLRGRSIFELGSGNMGAMNAARALGWRIGLGVFAVDVAKGLLAALAGLGMAAIAPPGSPGTLALGLTAGVGAVFGHAFSPFVGFRGGKALATAFGASLPVYPAAGLYAAALLLALTLIMLRRHRLAIVLTALLYPVVAYLAETRLSADLDRIFAVVTATLVITAVVLVRSLPRRPPVPGGG